MPIFAALAAAAQSAAQSASNETTTTSGTANAAAGGAPAAGAAAQGGAATLSDTELMYDVSLFLLAAAGVFFLVLLPRAIIRFTHKREWIDGHFLRSVRINASQKRAISPVSFSSSKYEEPTYGYKEQAGSSSDLSHTYASHTDLVLKNRPVVQNAPTHMPGVSTMFPAVAAALRYPTLFPGLSIGKAIVLICYATIIVFAAIFQTNPISDPKREGYVAAMQIPVVVLLGTKNNILGLLIGFGYERLNYLHRFAGTMMVLAANLHAIGYISKFVNAGEFGDVITQPYIQFGIVSVICCNLLMLLSTGVIRSRLYNAVFIPSHIVSAVTMCVTACYHQPWIVPYVLIATGLYGLDRLLRIVKTRITTASLRPLPDLGITRIEVPTVNAGWRAGQHVRLRVLSSGMGIRRWAESHPFTIASVSRCSSGEGLVLMVKKAGDWTNKLYDLAQRADYSEVNGFGGKVRVAIEGPYGGPGHAIFASFSGAIFVAGGSGITFALAAVQELLKKDLAGRSRVREMELVWCIQDPSALTPLVPLFSALVAQAQDAMVALTISVFYTRAPMNAEVLRTFRHLPPGLTLSPTRPRIKNLLKGVVDRVVASVNKKPDVALTGVIVGVCGPGGLGADVRKAVSGIDSESRSRVGGVELHEEAFGW